MEYAQIITLDVGVSRPNRAVAKATNRLDGASVPTVDGC